MTNDNNFFNVFFLVLIIATASFPLFPISFSPLYLLSFYFSLFEGKNDNSPIWMKKKNTPYSFPFIIISLGGAWINENDNVRMRTAASRQGIIDLFPLVSLLFYPCPPLLFCAKPNFSSWCQTKPLSPFSFLTILKVS